MNKKYTSFKKKIEPIRKNKLQVYKKMQKDAADPQTVAFYNNSANVLDCVDLVIAENNNKRS